MAAENGLERRRLGRSGLEVTCLGMGGAGIGNPEGVTDQDAVDTIRYALAHGINYIDTSPLYGESERRVGLALEGVPRSDYRLSTKTGTHPKWRGDYSWDGTLRSVENSLNLLKTDHIDLLLVHDPNSEQDMETIFGPRGAMEALEHLRAQGGIGSIGLGQRNHDWHRRAVLSGRVDVILTYNDYHPVRTTALTDGLLALAKQHGVGVINGSPLAFGLLTGADPASLNAANYPAEDIAIAKRLYDQCTSQQISLIAFVLQFCLQQSLIDTTLTGAKSVAELAQNLEAIQGFRAIGRKAGL